VSGQRHDEPAEQSERMLKMVRDAQKALEGVKGWEPTWLHATIGLTEGCVTVRTTGDRQSATALRETGWCVHGDETRGMERLPTGALQEWVNRPDGRWTRWNGRAWERHPPAAGNRPSEYQRPVDVQVLMLWGGTPTEVVRRPWGTVITFARFAPDGPMEWEVEHGTGRVRRIRSWSGGGALEWEEDREHEVMQGRMLMTRRARRWADGRRTEETLVWSLGAGAPTATTLAAPQP
jgi:hypothetical protein